MSNGCGKVNGVHDNGTGDVLRNRQLSEERRKQNEISANNVKERENGKPVNRRKVEEPKQKQPIPSEAGKSRKKHDHANQDVTVSRQESRVECNGKENNFGSRKKSEEKSEKKRQEPVSPEPPAPVCNNKDEGQSKIDSNSRLPQKRQGKKKKKISLGEEQQISKLI